MVAFQKEFDEGLYYFELDMGSIGIDNNAKVFANSDASPLSFGVELNNF